MNLNSGPRPGSAHQQELHSGVRDQQHGQRGGQARLQVQRDRAHLRAQEHLPRPLAGAPRVRGRGRQPQEGLQPGWVRLRDFVKYPPESTQNAYQIVAACMVLLG